MIEELLKKFAAMGYERVSMTLWNCERLYVNIKGVAPFWYALKRQQGLKGKISAHGILPAKVFRDAATLSEDVYQYRKDLIKNMVQNKAYTIGG